MIWRCVPFGDLTVMDYHQCMVLRCTVFIEEQGCLYPEADDKDPQSIHVMGLVDNELACYARILPPGVAYQEASIGRVVTAKNYRGQGLGKELIHTCMVEIEQRFRRVPIKLSGQSYLKRFYEGFGFQTVSEEYLEVGILHYKMLYIP